MKVTTAEFVKGINGTDPILQSPLPHIAFAGRSNVGKSSVINSLSGRKNLVKSSGEPGKTKEINFFVINKKYYFVDLPGYGFAKLPFKKREKLRKLILWYLTYSGVKPRYVVLIIDAQIGMTDLDREMLNILIECGHPLLVLANKIDRVKPSKRVALKRAIQDAVSPTPVFFYSAKSGEGREHVLRMLTLSP